jgi:protein SDA1
MIDLYRKNIWNDAKTVNIIASTCFSKTTKVCLTKYFFSFLNLNFLGSSSSIELLFM